MFFTPTTNFQKKCLINHTCYHWSHQAAISIILKTMDIFAFVNNSLCDEEPQSYCLISICILLSATVHSSNMIVYYSELSYRMKNFMGL